MEFRLEDQQKHVNGRIKDEGGGYRSMIGDEYMIGYGSNGLVAYIELPPNHPDIGRNYDELNPEVNGGLTFGRGRVFGWDYAHYENYGSPEEHIRNALQYFRKREV